MYTAAQFPGLVNGNCYVFFCLSELHNQKYERKRGYSASTPKNSSRGTENKISQSDGPRKKQAAAISAGKEVNSSMLLSLLWLLSLH